MHAPNFQRTGGLMLVAGKYPGVFLAGAYARTD
jgi:hypothetical protein